MSQGHSEERIARGSTKWIGTPMEGLTQNGMFFNAAADYKSGRREAEVVKVYEKFKPSIWVYNGRFSLLDAWPEVSNGRKVSLSTT